MNAIYPRILFLLLLTVTLAGTFIPFSAYAAVRVDPLVHCGTQKDASGQITNPCSTCDIFVIGQSSLNFIWKFIAMPIAVLMLLWSGFLMIVPIVGGEGGPMYERGKKAFLNTVIGILIIFFAWVAIDTVIKLLAGQIGSGKPAELNQYGPWNTIKCEKLEEVFKIPESAIKEKAVYWTYRRLPTKEEETQQSSADTGGPAASAGTLTRAVEIAETEWKKGICKDMNADEITKYGPGVVDNGTAAWCAAAVSYFHEKAGLKWGVTNKYNVPNIVKEWKGLKYKPTDILNKNVTVSPGDLIAYDFENKGWEHIGIITGFDSNNTMTVIEGNSSGFLPNGKRRDADCLGKKYRKLTDTSPIIILRPPQQ